MKIITYKSQEKTVDFKKLLVLGELQKKNTRKIFFQGTQVGKKQ